MSDKEKRVHQEYIRVVPGAKTAVLCVHGITNTPLIFNGILPLIPDNVSIYNILLDGHAKANREFSKTSMKKWKAQVRAKFLELSEKYEQIILTSHSMGAFFCIENAVLNPEKVKAMFIISAPMRTFLSWTSIKLVLKVLFEKIDDEKPLEHAARIGFSMQPTKKIWTLIPWIPKFLAFLPESKRCRALARQLKVPTTVFHSVHDELTKKSSSNCFKNQEYINLTMLPKSYHQWWDEEEYKMIQDSYASLFKEEGEKK